MIPELDIVTASYHRCRSSAGFFDTFYDRFLAKSPEVAEKFRNTDFKHQKLMLRESLVWMLSFNLGSSGAHDELVELAERHSRRDVDIPPGLYDLWLDSLCESVELHDPDFTPELTQAWRAAMRAGIALIVSKY